MPWGRFEGLRDVSAASLKQLNDMLQYLFTRVQGNIGSKNLSAGLRDSLQQTQLALTPEAIRASVGQIGGGNLLQDSSFEFGGGAWEAYGDGVTFTDPGRTGGVCARIDGALGTTRYIRQSVTLSAARGAYVLTGWIRTQSVAHGAASPFARLYAEVVDGGGATHYYQGEMPAGTNHWAQWGGMVIDPSGWANPTINQIRVYCYVRDCTGTLWFDDLQLEEGVKPTAWKPNAGELKSSAVEITRDRVGIRSGNVSITITDPANPEAVRASMDADADGFEWDRGYFGYLRSPKVVEVYDGPAAVYVGIGGAYASFRAFFERWNNCRFAYDVDLQYHASDTREWKPEGLISIRGLAGQRVRLLGTGKQIRARLEILGCANRDIRISGGTWANDETVPHMIYLYGAAPVFVTGLVMHGGAATSTTGANVGLMCDSTGEAYVEQVEMYKMRNAGLTATGTARIIAIQNKGLPSWTAAPWACAEVYYGGYIVLTGTRMVGPLLSSVGGEIVNMGSTENAGSATPPPPAETTVTRACTLRTYRGGVWRTDGDAASQAIQGDYTGSGNNIGHIWPVGGLPAGTVVRARLTLTRAGGGYGSARIPRVGASDRTGASGAPTLTNLYDEPGARGDGIAIGETLIFDIPEQTQAIMGTGRALALYLTGDLAQRYMRFSSAGLEVTYT